MKMMHKHFLGLAMIAAIGPALISTANAQLYFEIAKAPERAPKIAIIPFSNDQAIYPVVEQDLNRSGRFTSASKSTCNSKPRQCQCWKHGKRQVYLMWF